VFSRKIGTIRLKFTKEDTKLLIGIKKNIIKPIHEDEELKERFDNVMKELKAVLIECMTRL
jgi:hypothetical protein